MTTTQPPAAAPEVREELQRHEIYHCPHCGELNSLSFERSDEHDEEDDPNPQFQIVCDVHDGGCGSSSGFYYDPAKAAESWNARVSLNIASTKPLVALKPTPPLPTPAPQSAGAGKDTEPACNCADWGMMGHTTDCAVTIWQKRHKTTEAPPAAEAEVSAGDALLNEIGLWAVETFRMELLDRNVSELRAILARHRPTPDTLAALRKAGEALDSIVNPIAALQREAHASGSKLDGAAAVTLCKDPELYKNFARPALAAINAVLGQDGRVG